MSAITPEDKARFFPLLDDMGGMEEIYTVSELRQRLGLHPVGSIGAKKWCKGVSVHIDPMRDERLLCYHHTVVAVTCRSTGRFLWNY